MVHKAQRGEITRKKVDECYQAWKAHASKGNTQKVMKRMEEYYQALWEESNEIQACRRPEGTEGTGKAAGTGDTQQGGAGLQHHDG